MSAPTDLELMMLLDGELEGERRAEVEAFLAEAGEGEGAAVRSKLGGMRAVSRVVSSFDWPAAKGDAAIDIADLVMAALPASRSLGAAEASTSVAEPLAREVAAKKAPETSAPAAKKPPAATVPVSDASPRKPANDNSRAIFGFAIAAAAAAAALFFWGKTGDDPVTSGGERVAMTAPPVGSGATPAIPERDVVGDQPVGDLVGDLKDPGDEPRYGVEVATVDFGARSGAIYYVPVADLDDAAEKAVTTVVWLNDD